MDTITAVACLSFLFRCTDFQPYLTAFCMNNDPIGLELPFLDDSQWNSVLDFC